MTGPSRSIAQALEIMKKALGEGHPTYATGLNNLAALYYAMGAYDRAEPLYRQALEIRKKALGEGHPDYATSLNNLALLYYAMGAYDRAEPLFRQALEIRKKALGEGHPDYAISLNSLAALYGAMGAYDRAEPLCRQALEIRKKALGEEHPDYAISLSSLASLYQATNRPQQALTTLGRGMEVEQFNLGRVFAFSAEPAMRDYLDTVSRSLYGLLSIVIDGAATDPAAAETALTWTLRRKAVILQALCRFRDAQRRLAQDPALAQQALQFRGLRQRLSDWTLNPPPGASPETLRHQMDAWRQQADEVEADLNRALARHEQAQDPVLAQQAFQLRGLWQRLSDWTLNPPPGASPETLRHQMDAWRQQADELEAGLNRALARHEPQSARDGVDAAALRRRLPAGSALVELVRVDLYDFRATGFDLRLMSSLNDVSGIPTEGKNLIVVAAVNNVLHFRSFDGDGKVVVDTDEKRLTEQARKVEDLRKQLERLWPTHELTRSEKARVFTAVTSVVGHTLATVRAPRWKPAHYLAFVLTAGAQAPPRLIDLGDAAAIDDAVDLVRQSVIDAGSEFTDLAKTDKSRLPQAERTWYEEGFRQVSRPLYQQVFAPLRAALGPATLIYLAPDGELNCLPFEALVDDQGRYLIETYRFAYLSSGRDLLQAHPQPGHGTVVFAGPDYDLGAARRHAAAEPLLAALPAGPTPALRGAPRPARGGMETPERRRR